MLELWQARVYDATGRDPWPLTPKQRGQMSTIVAELPTNGRTATLADVIDWAASRWGEALYLSTPWLAEPKNSDKRAELLGKAPELSYFLYWIGNFFDAYETLHHGAGYSEHQLNYAERWQRKFKKAASGELSAAAAMDYASTVVVRRRNWLAEIFDGEVSKGRSRHEATKAAEAERQKAAYHENLRKAGFDPSVKHCKMTEEEIAEEWYTQMLDERDGA